MVFLTQVNTPVNGVKEMITGTVFPYSTGNVSERLQAEHDAKALGLETIQTLLDGEWIFPGQEEQLSLIQEQYQAYLLD